MLERILANHPKLRSEPGPSALDHQHMCVVATPPMSPATQ